MTGEVVAPEIPIEELFFLSLLSYVTLNVFGAAQKVTEKKDPDSSKGAA
jgi:uncharacterized membrane protein